MEETLIVDGYNVIHAWPELQQLASEKLEDARDKLIELLANFQGVTGMHVIVVFDGYRVKDSIGFSEMIGRIQVFFTKEGETADTLIERLTNQYSKSGIVRVATSDYDQQKTIFGQGAYRMSARELISLVKNKHVATQTILRPTKVTRDAIGDRLDPNIAEQLERIRRQ